MGLRFRKSINLGGGSRLNISKSGIGFSTGVKGARVTKKAGGGTRTTLSVPGTGISYVKDEGSRRRNTSGIKNGGYTAEAGNSAKVKKRKTWLWVLGWIFIFPVPLTVLMLRKKEMKPLLKYGIIALAWVIYLSLGAFNNDTKENTAARSTSQLTEIAETDTDIDDRSIVINETESSIESKKTVEEVPETTVAPIEVSSIYLAGTVKELGFGESVQITPEVSPSNAKNKNISWSSDDENVATVDSKGIVTAVGGGTAEITASADNGIKSSFTVSVDGTKRLMKLRVTRNRTDNNNIGSEWSFRNEINGESVGKEYTVAVGDNLKFYTEIVESDKKPDVGKASATHTVTQEDLSNGFSVPLDVYVTENGGKNSGKSAHFEVTYSFETE